MNNYQSNEYNSDGSMTPEYREQLRNDNWSEDEINNLEQIRMRHAAIDKECAECEKQHKKNTEEWRKKREAEKLEQARLGIEPTVEITYSSPDRIDPKSLNPAKRRAYEISGLSIEERLSQGYNNLDDLVDDSDEIDNDSYIPENPPPEIPF